MHFQYFIPVLYLAASVTSTAVSEPNALVGENADAGVTAVPSHKVVKRHEGEVYSIYRPPAKIDTDIRSPIELPGGIVKPEDTGTSLNPEEMNQGYEPNNEQKPGEFNQYLGSPEDIKGPKEIYYQDWKPNVYTDPEAINPDDQKLNEWKNIESKNTYQRDDGFEKVRRTSITPYGSKIAPVPDPADLTPSEMNEWMEDLRKIFLHRHRKPLPKHSDNATTHHIQARAPVANADELRLKYERQISEIFTRFGGEQSAAVEPRDDISSALTEGMITEGDMDDLEEIIEAMDKREPIAQLSESVGELKKRGYWYYPTVKRIFRLLVLPPTLDEAAQQIVIDLFGLQQDTQLDLKVGGRSTDGLAKREIEPREDRNYWIQLKTWLPRLIVIIPTDDEVAQDIIKRLFDINENSKREIEEAKENVGLFSDAIVERSEESSVESPNNGLEKRHHNLEKLNIENLRGPSGNTKRHHNLQRINMDKLRKKGGRAKRHISALSESVLDDTFDADLEQVGPEYKIRGSGWFSKPKSAGSLIKEVVFPTNDNEVPYVIAKLFRFNAHTARDMLAVELEGAPSIQKRASWKPTFSAMVTKMRSSWRIYGRSVYDSINLIPRAVVKSDSYMVKSFRGVLRVGLTPSYWYTGYRKTADSRITLKPRAVPSSDSEMVRSFQATWRQGLEPFGWLPWHRKKADARITRRGIQWDQDKLQSSVVVLRSIAENEQEKKTKRDLASDMIAYIDKLNAMLRATDGSLTGIQGPEGGFNPPLEKDSSSLKRRNVESVTSRIPKQKRGKLPVALLRMTQISALSGLRTEDYADMRKRDDWSDRAGAWIQWYSKLRPWWGSTDGGDTTSNGGGGDVNVIAPVKDKKIKRQAPSYWGNNWSCARLRLSDDKCGKHSEPAGGDQFGGSTHVTTDGPPAEYVDTSEYNPDQEYQPEQYQPPTEEYYPPEEYTPPDGTDYNPEGGYEKEKRDAGQLIDRIGNQKRSNRKRGRLLEQWQNSDKELPRLGHKRPWESLDGEFDSEKRDVGQLIDSTRDQNHNNGKRGFDPGDVSLENPLPRLRGDEWEGGNKKEKRGLADVIKNMMMMIAQANNKKKGQNKKRDGWGDFGNWGNSPQLMRLQPPRDSWESSEEGSGYQQEGEYKRQKRNLGRLIARVTKRTAQVNDKKSQNVKRDHEKELGNWDNGVQTIRLEPTFPWESK